MILWQMFLFSKRLGLTSTSIEIQDRRKNVPDLLIAVIQSLAVSLRLLVQSFLFCNIGCSNEYNIADSRNIFLVWLSDLNASMGIGGSIVILLSSMVLNILQDVLKHFRQYTFQQGLLCYLLY